MVQLAATNDNSIIVKQGQNSVEPAIHEEDAGEALTPGELCQFASDGDLETNDTAPSLDTDTSSTPKVVLETIGEDVDTDVSSGERARYVVPRPGDVLLLWLDTGSDAEVNVSKGDTLEPAGTDGNVRIQQGIDTTGDGTGNATETVFEGHVYFEAVEDLDNSAAGSRSRIKAMRV